MNTAITTHVLDTTTGTPAKGVSVHLDVAGPNGWERLSESVTADDGRIREIGPQQAAVGNYRLTFDTASYFTASGRESFFPEVTVTFTVADPTAHYHIPILLSPFAVSTYRGS